LAGVCFAAVFLAEGLATVAFVAAACFEGAAFVAAAFVAGAFFAVAFVAGAFFAVAFFWVACAADLAGVAAALFLEVRAAALPVDLAAFASVPEARETTLRAAAPARLAKDFLVADAMALGTPIG